MSPKNSTISPLFTAFCRKKNSTEREPSVSYHRGPLLHHNVLVLRRNLLHQMKREQSWVWLTRSRPVLLLKNTRRVNFPVNVKDGQLHQRFFFIHEWFRKSDARNWMNWSLLCCIWCFERNERFAEKICWRLQLCLCCLSSFTATLNSPLAAPWPRPFSR